MHETWITRQVQTVVIYLEDTRAASPLYVTYDFERDGYVLSQERITDVNGYIETLEDNEEVAFVSAWNEDTNEDR